MMKIKVRDYRGIIRADIELAPVALVAGQNAAGKSSLAEAVRAAVTGEALIVPGLRKKDAKLVVHDGADEGFIQILNGEEGCAVVSWPKAEVKVSDADEVWASGYAAGTQHLLDLDDRERAKVLARYIDSEPAKEDVGAAMQDLGYQEKAINRTWDAITKDGWDGVYQRARDYTVELKGKWGQLTGEKWGVRKAEGWKPDTEGSDFDDSESPEDLHDALHDATLGAETELEKAIASQAVSETELAQLRQSATRADDLRKQHKHLTSQLDRVQAEREEMEEQGAPKVPTEPMACPKCETRLILQDDALVEVIEVADKAGAVKDRESYFKQLTSVRDQYNELRGQLHDIGNDLASAELAAEKLADIENSEKGSTTAEDVEAARAQVDTARKREEAYDVIVKSSKIHESIKSNEELVKMLAPTGLRQRKLVERLSEFNADLKTLCEAATWPVVRFDENLDVFYGTRPLWAASSSGRWRARAVIQSCMAQMDHSAVIVLDEADILDTRGRNGLFAMLSLLEPKALVCMTINKPGQVPDLQEAGMGHSYWVAAGEVQPIEVVE